MPMRALLLALILASPVLAAGDSELIDDNDLKPQLQELQAKLEQLRSGTLSTKQLVQYYEEKAQAKGTAREQAINAFLFGFVLRNVMHDDKAARRQFDRAIKLYRGILPAYTMCALIAEDARDRKEAERLLRKVLELNPEYVPAIVQQAQMAARDRDFDRALALFKRSLDIELTVPALAGLIATHVQLFKESYDDEQREEHARAALGAVDAWAMLEPDNPYASLAKAQVLQDLGRTKQALDFLEDLYAAGGLKPNAQIQILQRLRMIYQFQQDVDGVERTIKRLIATEGLPPEERERYQHRLEDVQEKGRAAFVKWKIEELLDIVRNQGRSVEHRQLAQRMLLEFLRDDLVLTKEHQELFAVVFRESFRLMLDGPPELVVEMMRFLRNHLPDPRLIRILVHYIHPEGKTDEIREETVRTLGTCGGIAALPALYYSLQDASGRVVREVDNQLAKLCERRSPFGGRLEPLTDDEIRQVRRIWATYFHSEEGGDRLARAFADLSTRVKLDPNATRDLTSAPMIDHAMEVLLDNDMPWSAWSAAYTFLVNYWGKDFRPVERRGTAVEPFEREHVVRAMAEYRSTPPGDAGMADGGK